MSVKIALVGNPNSGKTTLFNKLTGSNQYVGNWPGVTVEKKSGYLKGHKDIEVIDLPGIYSLSPYTQEEVITRDYLISEKIDGIINIIDSTNIERNLYLTSQLLEMDIPIILALNMMDLLETKGILIDSNALSKNLGCEVVSISASKGFGVESLLLTLLKRTNAKVFKQVSFSHDVQSAVEFIKKNHQLGKAADFIAIKLLEQDEQLIKQFPLNEQEKSLIISLENNYDDTVDGVIANQRYDYIKSILEVVITKSGQHTDHTKKIDHFLTHRWLGLPLFCLVMFGIYYLAVSSIGQIAVDWMNDVLFGDIIYNFINTVLVTLQTEVWLNSLILDGILAGVGAVLGFVPQIAILFFLIGLLEDTGYMARIAFMLDRIFRRFNLSGKSIIPMLIGSGCSVPGIMASRTIENEDDRRLTVMTTSFIPCSAKLPIIALVAGALFADAWWVAPSIYFVGIMAVMFSGVLLKKINVLRSEYTPFVMELPSYHLPRIANVIRNSLDKVKSFMIKAGTVIFISSIVIWFLSNYNWALEMVDSNVSILASVGKFVAPVFTPLGFGNWQATIATINGLVAKESVVSALGILYGVQEVSEAGNEIWATFAQSFNSIQAYSFLLFNMICIPCFAACGAIVREMNSAKWTMIALGYQTLLAYIVAFVFYQIGSLVAFESFSALTIVAFIILISLIYVIFIKKDKGLSL